MAQPVIMVIGVAGSGKTWVCEKLKDQYAYVPHDTCWRCPSDPAMEEHYRKIGLGWGPKGSVSSHWETLVLAAGKRDKPVITEVPFGETKLKQRLEAAGIKVIPVFVVEDEATINSRFALREGRQPDAGAMTRARGLRTKAEQWNAYAGTSDQVLEHLKSSAFGRQHLKKENLDGLNQ